MNLASCSNAAEVRLAEGILATSQKRWQEAEVAFQQAVEINRQYHLPYYEARSLLEWGEMYLSRSYSGDRERAMQLLDQALAIFQRIQPKRWWRRCWHARNCSRRNLSH